MLLMPYSFDKVFGLFCTSGDANSKSFVWFFKSIADAPDIFLNTKIVMANTLLNKLSGWPLLFLCKGDYQIVSCSREIGLQNESSYVRKLANWTLQYNFNSSRVRYSIFFCLRC